MHVARFSSLSMRVKVLARTFMSRSFRMARWLFILILIILLYQRTSPIAVPILEAMDQVIDELVDEAMKRINGFDTFPLIDNQSVRPRAIDEESLRFVPPLNRLSYAKELAKCAEPGPNVHALVEATNGRPVDRLVESYRLLRTTWTYRRDDLDGVSETFQRAEDSLGALEREGDCEDLSAVMLSVCRVLKIPARIVICKGKTPLEAGHAYAEALIASDHERASAMLEYLSTAWGLARLPYREDSQGIWVRFDFEIPSTHYDGGIVAYYIWPDGSTTEP
ncbi:MAG TPA: hypothetical protein DDZ51_17160 [Planctomycetaceae bacterium]|nr:hypothetical protein [Planctomycetaceae bacterium]